MGTCPDFAREIHRISVGGTGDVFADLGVSAYRENLRVAAEIRRVVGSELADPEFAATVRRRVLCYTIERLRDVPARRRP